MRETAVTLVVPVKELDRAKTRTGLGAEERRSLVLSMGARTLSLAAASPVVARVVVVGAREVLQGRRDVVHVPEPRGGGLDPALAAARRWAVRRAPHDPLAVLPVDLTELTVSELTAGLRSALEHSTAFVPDRGGRGTTLVTARDPRVFVSAYGPGSAARHARLGMARLDHVGRGLRADVDTLDELRRSSLAGSISLGR